MISYKVVGSRNPVIEFFKDSILFKKLQIIGDPHFGRSFKTGVPINKLGQRESSIENTFRSLLNNKDATDIVIVGDLFDKSTVSNSIVIKVFEILKYAALENPNINYFIISGNHDLYKDTSKKSSFDVLENLLEGVSKNLKMISYPEMFSNNFVFSYESLNLIFYGYNPYETVTENTYPGILDVYKKESFNVSIGHWEVEDFSQLSGSSKLVSNVIPQFVKDNSNLIITGHEHKPKIVPFEKVLCIVSGSMEPYAHGEQLDTETIYTTHTLKQVLENLEKDANYYSNTNIRILFSGNDQLPDNFSCLSKTYKLLKSVSTASTEDASSEDDSISFEKGLLSKIEEFKKDCKQEQVVIYDKYSSYLLNKEYISE